MVLFMEVVEAMLPHINLRNFRSHFKHYKMIDHDSMYVAVTPACSISFHYNHSINGRQETINFSHYGLGGRVA